MELGPYLTVSDEIDSDGEVEIYRTDGSDVTYLDADSALKLTQHLERVFNLSGAKQCNDNK